MKTYTWVPEHHQLHILNGSRRHVQLPHQIRATRFDCGTYNNGAIELAYAILFDHTRENHPRSLRLADIFAREVIAMRSRISHWQITAIEMSAFIASARTIQILAHMKVPAALPQQNDVGGIQ